LKEDFPLKRKCFSIVSADKNKSPAISYESGLSFSLLVPGAKYFTFKGVSLYKLKNTFLREKE